LRVRFLRTACPACWLLDVSRLIASRMVFRAQGESPAPRSWKRRATCSRRVVRRVCSELIMLYGKLTILDFETPLAATRLPTRRLATSHSAPRDFPLGRLRLPSGSFANPTGKSHSELSAGEWDFQIAARKASGRTGGAPRGGEGGGSRGEAALAVSHSAARVGGSPLPCARHFLWGTFLRAISCLGSWVVNRPPIILVVERGHLRPFAPHDLFKAYFSFHRVHRDGEWARPTRLSPTHDSPQHFFASSSSPHAARCLLCSSA
jgi:hypothetical protein